MLSVYTLIGVLICFDATTAADEFNCVRLVALPQVVVKRCNVDAAYGKEFVDIVFVVDAMMHRVVFS